jgi:hypothetical protein
MDLVGLIKLRENDDSHSCGRKREARLKTTKSLPGLDSCIKFSASSCSIRLIRSDSREALGRLYEFVSQGEKIRKNGEKEEIAIAR